MNRLSPAVSVLALACVWTLLVTGLWTAQDGIAQDSPPIHTVPTADDTGSAADSPEATGDGAVAPSGEAAEAIPTEPVEAPAPGRRGTDIPTRGTVDDGDPDIVVTGTAWARNDQSLGRSSKVITADDVRRTGATNVGEALAGQPGVSIQKTGRYGPSPFIRGFTSYQNLILVDGIRFNNAAFRSGPNQYMGLLDPFAMDRMEVIYGPGSVLYGSDAIGGTVSIFTARWTPEDYEKGPVQTRLFSRVGSGDYGWISSYRGTFSFDQNSGLVVTGTSSIFGDLRSGEGQAQYTDHVKYDGNIRYTVRLDEHTALDIIGQYTFLGDGKRTHRTINAQSFEGTDIGSDRKHEFDHDRALAAVQFTQKGVNNFYNDLFISLSWHLMTEERLEIRDSDGRIRDQRFEINQFGGVVKMRRHEGDHDISWGVDGYLDRGRTYRFTNGSMNTQGAFGDDAWYVTLGAYVQDEWYIDDNVLLTAGVRGTYNHVTLDRVEDPNNAGELIVVSTNFAGVAGNLRGQYFFNPQSQVYLDASVGFRAPSFVDLTEQDRAAGDFVIPSLDVDPEYFVTFELGSKWETADRVFRGRLSGFASILSGLLVREPTGNLVGGDPEVRYTNAGDGYLLGGQIVLILQPLDEFEFTASFSYSSGQVDTPSNGTDFLSKHNPAAGRVGIKFVPSRDPDTRQELFWVEWFVQWTLKQGQLSRSDRGDTQRIPPGGTPGWATFNVQVGWIINPNAKLFLNLLNITDLNYRVHGSGDNEPGFNAVFGFQFDF